jgi:hypothetical protein
LAWLTNVSHDVVQHTFQLSRLERLHDDGAPGLPQHITGGIADVARQEYRMGSQMGLDCHRAGEEDIATHIGDAVVDEQAIDVLPRQNIPGRGARAITGSSSTINNVRGSAGM